MRFAFEGASWTVCSQHVQVAKAQYLVGCSVVRASVELSTGPNSFVLTGWHLTNSAETF